MEATVEWREPPPANKGKRPPGRYAQLATELRDNPGRWARVCEGVSGSMGTHLRKQFGADFEFVNRKGDNGTDIYGRYVGGESA